MKVKSFYKIYFFNYKEKNHILKKNSEKTCLVIFSFFMPYFKLCLSYEQ